MEQTPQALKDGNILKRTWNFIWNDNSILAWVISLIVAFVIVKFVFFPLLSFIFGTGLPLVVVESGSMHHPGSFLGDTFSTQSSFNTWWNQNKIWYEARGITKEQASSWKMRTGMEKGDIIVVYGRNKNLKVGDIIIFPLAGYSYPIIHRIVNITEINGQKFYSTKGDNNNVLGNEQLPGEKLIPESSIIGRAVFKIPKLGWLKLAVVNFFGLFRR